MRLLANPLIFPPDIDRHAPKIVLLTGAQQARIAENVKKPRKEEKWLDTSGPLKDKQQKTGVDVENKKSSLNTQLIFMLST